ncbi:divergent PAP2 family protein [Paenibacillus xerothermodurans]|uniref:Divergent PAP2 family protein n=1 Tax=Paenibacillus xerothermodurans TaxID=1977292 RepID=A0A2W1NDV0_PAEXE|nr:divergent PAP2 family protein [Paenibacillus xerothermodurans]PZE22889.1 divergent PAP2 family protein [Paenibacillus xerothermodurans]
MNRALLTAAATIGLAQFSKIPITQLRTGQWDWNLFFKTGGMPSSHSAAVNSLTTYIGLKKGIDSLSFALAGVLCLIVMYDAMGIRRHAGQIATGVNALEDAFDMLVQQNPSIVHKERIRRRLEESLGHLPSEVAGGALLGICTGALSYAMEKPSPKQRLRGWLC